MKNSWPYEAHTYLVALCYERGEGIVHKYKTRVTTDDGPQAAILVARKRAMADDRTLRGVEPDKVTIRREERV